MTRIAQASFEIDDYWRIVDVLHRRCIWFFTGFLPNLLSWHIMYCKFTKCHSSGVIHILWLFTVSLNVQVVQHWLGTMEAILQNTSSSGILDNPWSQRVCSRISTSCGNYWGTRKFYTYWWKRVNFQNLNSYVNPVNIIIICLF